MSAAIPKALRSFVIEYVDGLEEGREKGRGCFGAVYEVRVNGVPCIAKRLHDILVGRGWEERVREEEKRAVIRRFQEECSLLSGLRHPNVVQFMGVHFGRDEADISLIMEYMHMDLEQCMKTYPDIPLPYKISILRDVAYGLAYLHSIPIIHRDLNAGNVLLSESLRAKIADLGMSKLFDEEVLLQRTKTICPGAHDFMPPEALTESPKYGVQLDTFSFGHLTIYLSNQKVPSVTDLSVTPNDVEKKQMQVGKRRGALNQMGSQHPLYSTAVKCLSDTPEQRPSSAEVVTGLEEILKNFPLPHKNSLEALRSSTDLKTLSTEFEQLKKQHIKMKQTLDESVHDANTKQREIEELQKEIAKLQDDLAFTQVQVRLKVYCSKCCPHVSVVMCIGPDLPGRL